MDRPIDLLYSKTASFFFGHRPDLGIDFIIVFALFIVVVVIAIFIFIFIVDGRRGASTLCSVGGLVASIIF